MLAGSNVMSYYPAFIHYEVDHAHSVFFPDLPGCYSAGDTLDEAFANAREALAFHIEGLREDKLTIPKPSSLDALKKNAEFGEDFANENVTLIRVPLLENKVKPKRINISLNPTLINAIDQAAKEQGMTRSAFLASAALQHLG